GGTGHNEVEGGGGGRDQQAGNQDGNAAGLGSGQGRFLSRGSIPCNEPAARRATSAERCGIIRRMPNLLLNLRQVPADEASEVRELLSRHAIDFYETTPSQWGISHGGI